MDASRYFVPLVKIDDDTYAVDNSYSGDLFELSKDQLHHVTQIKIKLQTWSELQDLYYNRTVYATVCELWTVPMISINNLSL